VATASRHAEVVVDNPGGGRLHIVARRAAGDTLRGAHPGQRSTPAPELHATLLLDGEHLAGLAVCREPGGRRYSTGDRAVVDALLDAASHAIAGDPLANQLRCVTRAAERRRLARDLHDTVLQQVVGTGLALSSAARNPLGQPAGPGVARALQDLEATAATLRSVVGHLAGGGTPQGTSTAGPGSPALHRRLLAAVHTAAGGFTGELTVRVEGPVGNGVDGETADHVVAAAGECVANAARHAGATRIGVAVRAYTAHLVVRVGDNGNGWQHDPGVVPHRRGGRGLGNLAARAAEAGGGLQVTARPGRGSEVLWWVRYRHNGSVGYAPGNPPPAARP
jgi:signal transduction histidine kinase